jgi:hypothetical protein
MRARFARPIGVHSGLISSPGWACVHALLASAEGRRSRLLKCSPPRRGSRGERIRMASMRWKIAFFFLTLAAILAAEFASAQGGSGTITPQSLAGDWHFDIGPEMTWILHLSVDAGGAMAGSITVVQLGQPGKPMVLNDVQLSGNTLSYKEPGSDLKIPERILPDGRMVGAQLWVRGGVEQVTPPSAQEIAGDWATNPGSSNSMLLRLRLGPGGVLTGTLDTTGPSAQRLRLSDIQLNGRTLSFKTAEGSTLQGIFTKDKQSIMGISGLTFRRDKTLAQALAQDANTKPLPTDGAWTGTVPHIPWSAGIKHEFETLQFTFVFTSAPVSCSMDGSIRKTLGPIFCTMTREGNRVHVAVVMGAYDGTLNGSRITGAWKFDSRMYSIAGAPFFQGPMELDLTRTDAAPAGN